MNKIFARLPYGIQNLAISLYGYRQSKIRYGSSVDGLYSNYFSVKHSLSSEEVDAIQVNALRRLIHSSVKNVPYYERIYSKDKFDVDQFLPSDLPNAFPVINKEIVRDNHDLFVSSEYSKNNLITLHTSGSTGSPSTFHCTKSERSINYLFFRKILQFFNADFNSRSATFAGRMVGGLRDSQIGNFDYANRTLYLSSYRIGRETVGFYIEKLNNFKPVYIDSYPSSLVSLITLAKEFELPISFKPNFVLVSSETLSEDHRRLIEGFFGAPVVDQYGSTEMVASFWRGDNEQYTVDPLYCIPEFLSSKNGNVELVSTGLFVNSMPLIRYATGDEVAVDEFGSIVQVIGREDDVIETPSGNRVGRLDPAFKGLAGINASQIIQVSPSSVDVYIETGFGFEKQSLGLLENNLIERIGSEMTITIKIVERIKRTTNGKFKSVVGLK